MATIYATACSAPKIIVADRGHRSFRSCRKKVWECDTAGITPNWCRLVESTSVVGNGYHALYGAGDIPEGLWYQVAFRRRCTYRATTWRLKAVRESRSASSTQHCTPRRVGSRICRPPRLENVRLRTPVVLIHADRSSIISGSEENHH